MYVVAIFFNLLTVFFHFFLSYFSPHTLNRQYMITTMPEENIANFPILMESKSNILTCRAKGVPQRIKEQEISLEYFQDVVMRNQSTRKATVYSMRKRDFKISIVKSSKKLLSNFTSKRLYNSSYRCPHSFLSFPLHFKELNLVE